MTPVHRFLRWWDGGYYRLCGHSSHRIGLPCFRGFVYDGYCSKHNDTCFHTCEPIKV